MKIEGYLKVVKKKYLLRNKSVLIKWFIVFIVFIIFFKFLIMRLDISIFDIEVCYWDYVVDRDKGIWK